jgi:hypothetical protein
VINRHSLFRLYREERGAKVPTRQGAKLTVDEFDYLHKNIEAINAHVEHYMTHMGEEERIRLSTTTDEPFMFLSIGDYGNDKVLELRRSWPTRCDGLRSVRTADQY